MPHQLLLATRNKGKIEEFRRILEAIAPGQIELLGLDKFPELHDVVEDGKTFQENALIKAEFAYKLTGLPTIADDGGFEIDYLVINKLEDFSLDLSVKKYGPRIFDVMIKPEQTIFPMLKFGGNLKNLDDTVQMPILSVR